MLLLLLLSPTLASVGVDVSQGVSVSAWQCLRQPGGQGPVQFAIPRIYTSGGSVDQTGVQSVINAHNAGVQYVDGYIFPCVPCGNPAGQMTAAKNGVDAAGAKIGIYWLDVEAYQWSSNQGANQAFLQAMINQGAQLGITMGIYANWNSWSEIVGGWTFAHDKGLPIWYPHYDNSPSFSDFQPFGGWTRPNIKQYIGDDTSCGVGVDYNWYPDGMESILWNHTDATIQ